MPEVRNGDVSLHVEVDGTGEPVTIFAHGLTNSCRELAPFTPSLAGTAAMVLLPWSRSFERAATGYRFADLASDLDVVARATARRTRSGPPWAPGRSCRSSSTTRPLRPDRDAAARVARPSLPQPGEVRRDRDLLEGHPKDQAIGGSSR